MENFHQSIIQSLNSMSQIARKVEETIMKQISNRENLEHYWPNTYPVKMYDKVWLNPIPKTKGIYFIEAKIKDFDMTDYPRMAKFRTAWNAEKKAINLHRPECIDVRLQQLAKQPSLNGWVPLYLGKSEKIAKRLKEHIHGFENHDGKHNKLTWALRLEEEQTASVKNITELRVNILELDLDTQAYQFANVIERELRKRLSPIIGKQ